MTLPVRVLLVSYGFASATFHAPLIQAVPGLALAGVVSRDPAKVHANWPGLPVYPDLTQALAQCDASLVVIATPNDTHHRLAVQALAARRHVVVDKPFTLTLAEADDLIARAAAVQRVLSVFQNRRWDGDFLGIRQLLASGVLGRVTHFESHFDRFRPKVRSRWREAAGLGGGLWYDLGPHLLDQALQLFGLPDAIWLDSWAQRDGAQADDWCHAVLRYPCMRVVLHASALTARLAPRFLVHGTTGSYEKWGLDSQEDQLKAGFIPGQNGWGDDPIDGQLTLVNGDELFVTPVKALSGDYRAYYVGVRDALWGVQAEPHVTSVQVRQVMALIEAGRISKAQQRWVRLAELGLLPDQCGLGE